MTIISGGVPNVNAVAPTHIIETFRAFREFRRAERM
jgi:hypothetical protein